MLDANDLDNLTVRVCDANISYAHARNLFLEMAQTSDVTTMTVFLAFIAIVGCIGNGLVIMVCSKYPTKFSTQRFVVAMAVIDLFVCVAIIPYRVVSYHRFLNERACKIFEGLTYFTVLYSMFLLIAIAVDRYHAVCRATDYHKLTNATGSLIFAIAFLTLGISIYPGIIAGHYITVIGTNETVQCFTGICNEDGQDRRFSTAPLVLLYSAGLGIMYASMVLIVIICYTKVFQTLYSRYGRVKKIRKESAIDNSQHEASVAVLSICDASVDDGGKDSRLALQFDAVFMPPSGGIRQGSTKRISHRRTAKILLLVTVAFIITWLPFMLMKTHLVPNIVTLRLTFFISNMINPVIYSFTNHQFRANVCKLLKSGPTSPR